jgi:predicted TIM-barrel fold metal-dependent hydrolase
MIYLDCNASIGMHGPTDARIPFKKSQLLDDMEHTGIHGSLIWHWLAKEYDPMYGNKVLMEEIAGNPRLLPVWVVLPHWADEFPQGDELADLLTSNGVKAVKMFPKRQNYAFNEMVCGRLFDVLEDLSMPLLLDCGNFGDHMQVTFDELDQFCHNRPGIPVIIQNARWERPRDFIALMDTHKNTFIEFSNYQIHYGPEFMAEKVGADRLLLGTEWPFKSPGAARSFVDYCELSTVDKAAFAGGNLARILKLDTMPGEYPDKDQGLILKKAKAGQPMDHIPVIDPHTHILHDGLMGSGYIPIPYGDCEHMVRRNRRIGIDRFACSSWIGIWIDYARGNELIKDLCDRYPDDIIGYAAIDPKKSDDFEADIKLCHDTYGFRGIKPYNPRVGIPYNDPSYDPWYKKGNEIGAFVKLHQTAIGDNFLNEIADISERYPNMNYLLAHSGWTWEVARSRVKLAKERKNIYLDLTFTSVLHGVVEYFVDEGLADKVLFTTDAPMRDAIPQFGWVAYAKISEEDKEKALGGNMLKLLAHAGLDVSWAEVYEGRKT